MAYQRETSGASANGSWLSLASSHQRWRMAAWLKARWEAKQQRRWRQSMAQAPKAMAAAVSILAWHQ